MSSNATNGELTMEPVHVLNHRGEGGEWNGPLDETNTAIASILSERSLDHLFDDSSDTVRRISVAKSLVAGARSFHADKHSRTPESYHTRGVRVMDGEVAALFGGWNEDAVDAALVALAERPWSRIGLYGRDNEYEIPVVSLTRGMQ